MLVTGQFWLQVNSGYWSMLKIMLYKDLFKQHYFISLGVIKWNIVSILFEISILNI